MTARVTDIFRHPIKSHGVEAIARTTLAPGETLPWDRVWAVPHEAAGLSGHTSDWKPCNLFSRGAKTPGLVAITARLNTSGKALTLAHPDLAPLTIWPDEPADILRFLAWIAPLSDPARACPSGIVRASTRGMTDTDFPSISILSRGSLADLSARAGKDLSPLRFRGNIWLNGLPAWEEFNLIGREITIGGATLRIREAIGRCRATSVNPATGRANIDMLSLLKTSYGHTNFGVYAEVVRGGPIAVGDSFHIESA